MFYYIYMCISNAIEDKIANSTMKNIDTIKQNVTSHTVHKREYKKVVETRTHTGHTFGNTRSSAPIAFGALDPRLKMSHCTSCTLNPKPQTPNPKP